MTLDDVKARVARVKAMAGDPEVAHEEEDFLYADLLDAIAKGECDSPAECAAEARKTADLSFARWRA